MYINLYAKGVPPPVPAAIIAVAGRKRQISLVLPVWRTVLRFIAGAGVIRSRR